MFERVQTVLMLVLVGAVGLLAMAFYRGQRASEDATALLIEKIEKNETTANLLVEKNEAAAATMLQEIERLERLTTRPAPSAFDRGPSVVATLPRTADRNVDPSITEIRVTYDKPMMDKNWSWCYDPDELETTGEPHYEPDGKTCVLPVKLRPGRVYTIRLNTSEFRNFMDASGRPAVPYILQFNTRQEAGAAAPDRAPTVVTTLPKTADRNVDPSITEIRVTYDKPMKVGSWSWGYDPKEIETTGEPHYEPDGKTCVLPVRLRPGKAYTIRLNTGEDRKFVDASGRPAVPYVLQFKTRQEAAPNSAEKRQ